MKVYLPEQTCVELKTAGYGSRGLAYIADFALRWLIIVVVLLGVMLISSILKGEAVIFVISRLGLDKLSYQMGIAILVIGFFVIEWGYSVYFEVGNAGVTPGKRLFGLRVVDSNALPVDFRASALRNTFLVVDLLPGFGLLALLSMSFSSKNQRLGDIVAGTFVIHDEGLSSSDIEVLSKQMSGELDASDIKGACDDKEQVALPSKYYCVLAEFLERKESMEVPYRAGLVIKLFENLRRHIPLDLHIPEDLFLSETEKNILNRLSVSSIKKIHSWQKGEMEKVELRLENIFAKSYPQKESFKEGD